MTLEKLKIYVIIYNRGRPVWRRPLSCFSPLNPIFKSQRSSRWLFCHLSPPLLVSFQVATLNWVAYMSTHGDCI